MSETTIYEYGNFRYYTGNSRVIGLMEGIPLGWTDNPLPPIPDGQFAVFSGVGWVLTSQPFVPPVFPLEASLPVAVESSQASANRITVL